MSATRLMTCGACGHAWEVPATKPVAIVLCPSCNAHVCACGCGEHLGEMRAHALYKSRACAVALAREGYGTTRAAKANKTRTGATVHPLSEVRSQQATKKHNRDLGGLIRQAIIDQIKTTGDCFADDLIDLYPEGEVKECRRLATAQFGSLTGCGLIREKERRKSTIASRKGAKSGVFVFTAEGRKTLVGNGAGPEGASSSGVASIVSGESSASVSRSPQGSGGSVSCPLSADADGSSEVHTSSASEEPPARLFDSESPSVYDPWKDAA